MKLKALALMLFTAGVLASSTLIAPATGADSPTTTPSTAGATDPISSLSATSITVGPLTCSIGASSPKVEFKIGDRVRIGCVNGSLYYIVSADAPGSAPPSPYVTHQGTITELSTTGIRVDDFFCAVYTGSYTGASPDPIALGFHVGDHVGIACLDGALRKIGAFGESSGGDNVKTTKGPITAISAASITVNDFTCTLNSSSPSVTSFKVGDVVGVACQNGVLVKIGLYPPPGGNGDNVKTTKGPITAISAASITVNDFTCTLNSSSPSVTSFKVGDVVGVACQNGVLVKIGMYPPPGGVGDNVKTTKGPITAISAASITVNDFTCTLNSSSPSVTSFKVGDVVGVACQNGVLVKIGTGQGDQLQVRLGTISSLSATSITVDGLTCSIGSNSPSTTAFKAGDSVGIGCASGTLVKIGTPQVDDGGFKVAIQLGMISALSGTSIIVGSLTCGFAATSPSVATFSTGDRVGIGCAGGILFMIGALPSPQAAPTPKVRLALFARFTSCVKSGSEHCNVESVLRRLVKKHV